MHTVHICIRCYHDVLITQAFKPFLNVQGRLNEIELLILINDLLGKSIAVEGFPLETEDGLGLNVPALRNGTAGAVYIFHTETGEELFKIDAPSGSNSNFGYGVAIEGNNLVVDPRSSPTPQI